MTRAFALLMAVAACSSAPGEVCQSIGECSQGGSADWIQQCTDEAHQLEQESATAGCSGKFDAYYSCATARYDCVGDKASFAGCEATRSAFDGCLERSRDATSCGQLEKKLASCAERADGGEIVRPACTAVRACQARCLLDHVLQVCAPGLRELDSFTQCAQSCPP